MNHMIPATAVYQDGVLQLQDLPLGSPDLVDGDRVEVVIVRVVPVDKNHPDEVAREAADRARRAKAARDLIAAGEAAAAGPGDEEDDVDEHGRHVLDRNRGGGRVLFPPEMKGITW
ncbi:MAG: hypothetical protein C0501_21095 [Isosphaera sp.]|nr:hypothetical protein [Isosphaera sp.]